MRTYPKQALKMCLASIILLCLCVNAQAMSPAEAAEQARSSTGGKVLQVKTRKDGRYRVKILMPNGQVKSISVGTTSSDNNDNKTSKKQ